MTGRQQKAVAAMLTSATRAEAAKKANVSISTLRKWANTNAEFRAAYRAALSELMEDASAQARQNLSTALNVLREIMESGDNEQARIAAARSALEYGLKLHEVIDVEMRLAELERRAGEEDK